jgi:hypothetical protein
MAVNDLLKRGFLGCVPNSWKVSFKIHSSLQNKDQTTEPSTRISCVNLECKTESTKLFFEVFQTKNHIKPITFELETQRDLVFEIIKSSLGFESLFC